MSIAKGEQESTETLSFRCDCERCRLMRGRKGRFAPQDDMVLKVILKIRIAPAPESCTAQFFRLQLLLSQW